MKCRTIFRVIVLALINLCGVNVMAADGLKTVPSEFGATETIDRLAAEVSAKGMTILARIDHAAGAAGVGLKLPPAVLLIFGSATAGTPLMQLDPAVGIDLPLKAVVYEDAQGGVSISYNDPRWIAERHRLSVAAETIVGSMSSALESVVARAARHL